MPPDNPVPNIINESLIQKICLQDRQALEDLYESNVDKMLGLAKYILNNKDDAEDIIHDVFIEVWHKAHHYDVKKSSVLGWLLLRVRSRCLDKIRKAQTRKKYLEKQTNEIEYQAKVPSETYTNYKFLEKSLNMLSDKQRFIIEMNYFKGLTCVEISQHYNIPLGTVKTRLLSAMQKMKKSVIKVKSDEL